MHEVRKRILEILKETGGATVAELAAELDMAPVSVRHHLDILQGDSLICVDRLARKGNVGRPQQIYALTDEASSYFPNNFPALAGRLVKQMKEMLPPEEVTRAFCTMARDIAADIAGEDSGVADLEQLSVEERLECVSAFLTKRGYLANWEAVAGDEGGYLLHKHNCPYASISGKHDELCLMDQVLIDTLLDQPCQRVESMAHDNRCTYHIRANDDDAYQKQSGMILFDDFEGQPEIELATLP